MSGSQYSGERANIGVELLQSRVRLNEINDLFWIRSGELNPESIYTIDGYNKAMDTQSFDALKKLGLKNSPERKKRDIKYLRSQVSELLRNVGFYRSIEIMLVNGGVNILRQLSMIFRSISNLNEKNWLKVQLYRFCQKLQ